jgi:hypothetical protein
MAKTKVPPARPSPKGLPLNQLTVSWTNGTRTERIKGSELVPLLEVSEQRLYDQNGPTLREYWTDPNAIAAELEQLSHVVALLAEMLPPNQDPNHQVIRSLLPVHGALEQLGLRVAGLAFDPARFRMTVKAGRR